MKERAVDLADLADAGSSQFASVVDQSPNPWSRFQEYWVDFLGGLLPGTLFLFGAMMTIFPTAVSLVTTLSLDTKTTFSTVVQDWMRAVNGTPDLVWMAFMFALLSVSFVLGHMFYRQDPKRPSKESFIRLKDKEIAQRSLDRYDANTKTLLNAELGCSDDGDCEFPYPHFFDYLDQRGLAYLEPFVVWHGEPNLRTKNYINILKNRLKFYFPNQCGVIVRNEAHIRLASSTWYVGKGLLWCCLASVLVIGLSALSHWFIVSPNRTLPDEFGNNLLLFVLSRHFISIGATLLVAVAASYMCRRIEMFLHYQRLREVVHVLELAWTAFSHHPHLLEPPFTGFGAAVVREAEAREALGGPAIRAQSEPAGRGGVAAPVNP